MISKKLLDCVDKVNFINNMRGLKVPHKCKKVDLEIGRFKSEIGFNLDEQYKCLMEVVNGVWFNGMVIFPLSLNEEEEETIIEANLEFQDLFEEDYIYYGNFDDELYCYNVKEKEYQAIEYSSDYAWNRFGTAEEMFIYMIERGLSSVDLS